MKNARIAIFREALDALLDALAAELRIARWTGPETVPEPLHESARQLVTRLGAANRLAAGRFSGPLSHALSTR